MSLTQRTAERSLAERHDAYVTEITAFVEATYRVIARTGTIEPTMREILAEAGLSTQAFYRHFTSKDELLIVILDDGRRRLVDYLDARIASAPQADERIEAWIRGVLAQATDPDAASRTRPFVANIHRLTERFPDEQRASEQLLVDQLAGLVDTGEAEADAAAIYRLTFATMEWHLRHATSPSESDIAHLVRFAARAIDQDPRPHQHP